MFKALASEQMSAKGVACTAALFFEIFICCHLYLKRQQTHTMCLQCYAPVTMYWKWKKYALNCQTYTPYIVLQGELTTSQGGLTLNWKFKVTFARNH